MQDRTFRPMTLFVSLQSIHTSVQFHSQTSECRVKLLATKTPNDADEKDDDDDDTLMTFG